MKWAMLWHGPRHSLSTQQIQLQLVSVYKPHVAIFFGKRTTMCALQWLVMFCTKAWMTARIGGCNMGLLDLPHQGEDYFKFSDNCNFRAKILKNNTKLRLVAPPLLQEKTGYIIQVYMLEGFEYEKIPLLVGGSFSKHGHHQIPCLCNESCLWPVNCLYQCYAPPHTLKISEMGVIKKHLVKCFVSSQELVTSNYYMAV